MRTHRIAIAAMGAAILATAAAAQAPAGDPRAGRSLAYAECRGCHGMDGKGTKPGVPNLGGRDAAELVALLDAYRAGKKQHVPIGWIARSAKPQELRDIAAYYSAQR